MPQPAQFHKIINSLRTDQTHGSGYILSHIIQTFLLFDPDPTEIKWAIAQLRDLDPTMRVVHHFLHSIDQIKSGNFHEQVKAYQEKWAHVNHQISRNLSKQLTSGHSTFLLHSHSQTVIEVLKTLQLMGHSISAYQTESLPGGEGGLQAKKLQTLLPVEWIPDDHATEIIRKVDTVILGTDQYDNHYFVNKVGSNNIVNLAQRWERPVFVLGDSRKYVKQIQIQSSLFESVRFGENVTLITESS